MTHDLIHINIGIITVNFNSARHTMNLVESIKSSQVKHDHILCIVDNNSLEKSFVLVRSFLQEKNINYKELNFRINNQLDNDYILHSTKDWIACASKDLRVLLVKLDKNIGFAAANNIGVTVLGSIASHFLIVNNDVIIEENLINELMYSFQHSNMCGISTGKIYIGKPDSNLIWYAGGRFSFEPKIFNRHPNRGKNDFDDFEREVTFASGALILTSKQIINKINLFHEAFFFGEEDAFFSYTILRCNYKILYNPKARCWHNVGSSRKKMSNNKWFNSKKNSSRFLLAALTAPAYSYYFWLAIYFFTRFFRGIFSSNKYNLMQDIKSLIYSLKMRYSDSFFESERLINSSKYLSN